MNAPTPSGALLAELLRRRTKDLVKRFLVAHRQGNAATREFISALSDADLDLLIAEGKKVAQRLRGDLDIAGAIGHQEESMENGPGAVQ